MRKRGFRILARKMYRNGRPLGSHFVVEKGAGCLYRIFISSSPFEKKVQSEPVICEAGGIRGI